MYICLVSFHNQPIFSASLFEYVWRLCSHKRTTTTKSTREKKKACTAAPNIAGGAQSESSRSCQQRSMDTHRPRMYSLVLCCFSIAQHLPCRGRGGGRRERRCCATAVVTRLQYAVQTEWGTEAAGSSMFRGERASRPNEREDTSRRVERVLGVWVWREERWRKIDAGS